MNKIIKNKLRNSKLRLVGFYILDVFNYFKYKVLKSDLVFVYQMGKVASSSIYNSLKEKKVIVYQIHRFNKEYIQEVHKVHKEKTGLLESRIVDERGIRLNNMFIKKREKPIYIISLVRDPIERNISAFFQNKEYITRNHKYSSMDQLIQLYYDLYDHDTPLTWFDKEFKNSLGVDIYKHSFSKEEKYKVFNANNFNILLLRVDLEDSKKGEIIGDFLGIKKIKLKNKNVGSSKAYNSEYKDFINKIKLNENYVNNMLKSKFVEYFYTSEEISLMEKKWLN